MSTYNPIIVTGTGRSGTSMVAGILRQLGIHMGYTMVPYNISNPKGHFEDIEFHYLNALFLKQACTEDAWYSEVIPLIKRRMAEGRPWGWKTPSTTDLIAYYTQLLPEAHYLVVRRNTKDIRESCIKAYDWDAQFTIKHIGERLARMDKWLPRVKNKHVVQFEELITEPCSVITNMLPWLEQARVRPSQAQLRAAIRSVDMADKKGGHGSTVKVKPSSQDGTHQPGKKGGKDQTIKNAGTNVS